jgi:hypothetical protein
MLAIPKVKDIVDDVDSRTAGEKENRSYFDKIISFSEDYNPKTSGQERIDELLKKKDFNISLGLKPIDEDVYTKAKGGVFSLQNHPDPMDIYKMGHVRFDQVSFQDPIGDDYGIEAPKSSGYDLTNLKNMYKSDAEYMDYRQQAVVMRNKESRKFAEEAVQSMMSQLIKDRAEAKKTDGYDGDYESDGERGFVPTRKKLPISKAVDVDVSKKNEVSEDDHYEMARELREIDDFLKSGKGNQKLREELAKKKHELVVKLKEYESDYESEPEYFPLKKKKSVVKKYANPQDLELLHSLARLEGARISTPSSTMKSKAVPSRSKPPSSAKKPTEDIPFSKPLSLKPLQSEFESESESEFESDPEDEANNLKVANHNRVRKMMLNLDKGISQQSMKQGFAKLKSQTGIAKTTQDTNMFYEKRKLQAEVETMTREFNRLTAMRDRSENPAQKKQIEDEMSRILYELETEYKPQLESFGVKFPPFIKEGDKVASPPSKPSKPPSSSPATKSPAGSSATKSPAGGSASKIPPYVPPQKRAQVADNEGFIRVPVEGEPDRDNHYFTNPTLNTIEDAVNKYPAPSMKQLIENLGLDPNLILPSADERSKNGHYNWYTVVKQMEKNPGVKTHVVKMIASEVKAQKGAVRIYKGSAGNIVNIHLGPIPQVEQGPPQTQTH